MTTDKFAIHYTSCRVTNDYAGNPCILIYYDYTNKNSSPSSAMTDVRLQAIQNGQTLETTLPAEDDTSVDQFNIRGKSWPDSECVSGIFPQR